MSLILKAIWLINLILPAQSKDIESKQIEILKIQQLLKFKDLKTMKKWTDKLDQYNVHKILCQSELKREKVPFNCFQKIKIENEIGLIKNDTFKSKTELLQVDCLNKLKRNQHIQSLDLKPSLTWGDCRREAQELKKRLEYADQDKNLQEI